MPTAGTIFALTMAHLDACWTSTAPVSSVLGAAMRENNSSSLSTRKRLTHQNNGSDGVKLRVQLESELDKLALLVQQVREQSARVQAAADAIGETILVRSAGQSLPATTAEMTALRSFPRS